MATPAPPPRPINEPSDVPKTVHIMTPDKKPFLRFGSRIILQDSSWIHQQLVLDACFIVTSVQGFISSSPDRAQPPVPLDQELICSGRYHFHALLEDHSDYETRMMPSFRDWEPPTSFQALPPHWSSLAHYTEISVTETIERSYISQWIKSNDKVCVVTGLDQVCNAAHCVPQAEEDWAYEHQILLKATNGAPIPLGASHIHDIRNQFTLESGAHNRFDEPFYCFYPIRDSDGRYQPVCYYFRFETCNSAESEHMRLANLPGRVHPYFLYCRFAWAIFQGAFSSINIRPPHKKAKVKDMEDIQEFEQDRTSDDDHESDESLFRNDPAGILMPMKLELCKSPEDALDLLSRYEARTKKGLENRDPRAADYFPAYPGITHAAKLKVEYVRQHPEAISVSDPSTEEIRTDVLFRVNELDALRWAST